MPSRLLPVLSRVRTTAALCSVLAAAALLVGVGCASKSGSARAGAPSTRAADVAPLTEEQRRLNVESFDVMWETVRDKHFDPATNGVDWAAVKTEVRPKVEAAATMNEARELMSGALHRLKQSHFGIIPSDVYSKVHEGDTTRPSGSGWLGVSVVVLDGRLVVKHVEPETPADRAGVRGGWVVSSVDGEEIAPLLTRLAEQFDGESTAGIQLQRAAMRLLQRPVGATAAVKFLNAEDASFVQTLTFVERKQKMVKFGNLPPMPLDLQSCRLEGDIGYISLSLWMDPAYVREGVKKALEGFTDTRGLIFDLRGNPGGIGGMAMGIGNFFVPDARHKLGTMKTRDGELNFVLNPQPTAYAGPLAILVDGGSASTSEIFAGGMKDIGRARIFGTRTPGLALPSMISKLPNGDGFQYVIANYISSGGQPLEANGVVPDEDVALTRAALIAGHDPVIDAASAWIVKQTPATRPPSTNVSVPR